MNNEQQITDQRNAGTLVFFNQAKAFGFIKPKGAPDDRTQNIFFHCSDSDYCTTAIGDWNNGDDLFYTLSSRDGRARAIDVKLPEDEHAE